jgi:hypothetical protein
MQTLDKYLAAVNVLTLEQTNCSQFSEKERRKKKGNLESFLNKLCQKLYYYNFHLPRVGPSMIFMGIKLSGKNISRIHCTSG